MADNFVLDLSSWILEFFVEIDDDVEVLPTE